MLSELRDLKQRLCLNLSYLIIPHTPASLLSCYAHDIGAGGLGFDSCASQIGHSVANISPPFAYDVISELCSLGAKLGRWAPPLVCHTVRRTPRVGRKFDVNLFDNSRLLKARKIAIFFFSQQTYRQIFVPSLS